MFSSTRQPVGRLVDVGGFRLHAVGAGHGQPTVLFDAALGGSCLSWSLVQPQIAAVTATCSYDRAGLGWSERGPSPRTAGRNVSELRVLLDRLGIGGPYVFVGHSFGTLVGRLFAARYPDEIAGLVLVEPAFPEDWLEPNAVERRRMRRAVRMCRYGTIAARLRLTGLLSSLTGNDALGLARAAFGFVSRRGPGRDNGVLAPMLNLPKETRALLTWMWTQPRFFEALGSHIGSIGVTAREVLDAERSFGDIPVVVISATEPHPHHVKMQERLIAASSRGRRVVAAASGHWIPLEEPEAVVAAVREVVHAIRSERPLQSAAG